MPCCCFLALAFLSHLLQVRPEDVLEKALHMVETSEKNYLYKCDQLKSIRQDLTVQRIQNELTVKVFLDNNLSLWYTAF